MDLAKGIDALASKINIQSLLENIDYRVARTKEEIKQCYALVHREYLKRKYTTDNNSGLRLSLFNAHPRTTTFIAATDDAILATATVILDSELGLPMDKIYREEVDQFRANNKKLCEISMLASDTELFKGGSSMMLNAKKLFFIFFLFKIIFDYTKDHLNLDYICITINPKHKLTYDFLLFKDFGNLKSYGNANDAPAIAKYLDLASAEEECKQANRHGLYKMFFLRKTEAVKFKDKYVFTQEDLRHFFWEKTTIFQDADPNDLACIKRCYPEYDFTRILT